jgi:PAS domain S-box-containing protein
LISNACGDLFGRQKFKSRDRLGDYSTEDLASPQTQPVIRDLLHARNPSLQTVPVELNTADGRIYKFQLTGKFSEQSERFYFIAKLQTPHFDEQLRWRLALEGTNAGFWDWDLKANTMYLSPRYRSMLGYTESELPANFEMCKSLIHPEDAAHSEALFESFSRGLSGSLRIEYRMRMKSGEYRWILAMGAGITDELGQIMHASGWHFDIHEQKLAAENLRVSEERSRAILEAIPDLLFVTNRDGVYLAIHASRPEDLIAPRETLLGRSIKEFLPPDVTETFLKTIATVLETGKILPVTYELMLPSGPGYFEARVVRSSEKNLVLIVVRDVSENHKAQAAVAVAERRVREQEIAMIASSRLAALGEMAGGIAHEINNPLTIIHAHASRLRDLAASGRIDQNRITSTAEKIEQTAMRISHIVAGLRAIARDGTEDRFVRSKVKSIVVEAVSLCSEKLRHKQIELRVDDISEDLEIDCRSVQICQVLTNLLSNAQHAVESQNTKRWIHIRSEEQGDFVSLIVSDSGSGIEPEKRERIFDPFFTTKDVGKGMGLGLSVSASIVKSHSGTLSLQDGQGPTTFVVRLPRVQK